jgi:hypothetical protein
VISAVAWRQCVVPVLNPDSRSRTATLSGHFVIFDLCGILRHNEIMTRKLRTALTAVLLLGLVAGGAGAAAAEQCDIDKDVDNDTTTIINDNDLIDVDNTLTNITTNVLGIQIDDSPANVASASMY